MDKALRCDHLNEICSVVLKHGIISFSIFYKMKFGMFRDFWFLHSWEFVKGYVPTNYDWSLHQEMN